ILTSSKINLNIIYKSLTINAYYKELAKCILTILPKLIDALETDFLKQYIEKNTTIKNIMDKYYEYLSILIKPILYFVNTHHNLSDILINHMLPFVNNPINNVIKNTINTRHVIWMLGIFGYRKKHLLKT